jgi:hypothetical protein
MFGMNCVALNNYDSKTGKSLVIVVSLLEMPDYRVVGSIPVLGLYRLS